MKLFDAFAYPWVLPLAVILVPLVWWTWRNPRRRAALRFPSLGILPESSATWSTKARVVLPILRSIAVILLVVCIARPRKIDELTRVQTEGVALELVIDRSGSMGYRDFPIGNGRFQSRLEVVKAVVHGFIAGDGESLPGRPDDLIGLTVFGTFADTLCPLTWDHQHVLSALKSLQVPMEEREQGTSIGDALLLGIERIRNIDRRFSKDQDFKLTSRAVILLSDGQQTTGKFLPQQAAEAAKALGIKIYTIGAVPPVPADGQMIDEEMMRRVAELTGGEYFRAATASALIDVYAAIDKLERSTVDEKRYYLYEELSYRWIDVAGVRLPPPLLVALIALGLEQLLANTRFRRIP
ncbi:MAG TPA: VWA domain-containing protein [Phycisphaerae bacterium]|nr:VWA domain-containing protein [Phycisphaerae bacterium]